MRRLHAYDLLGVPKIRRPGGPSGSADEIAWLVAWLCTPGAAYLIGRCLVVDGGSSVAGQLTR